MEILKTRPQGFAKEGVCVAHWPEGPTAESWRCSWNSHFHLFFKVDLQSLKKGWGISSPRESIRKSRLILLLQGLIFLTAHLIYPPASLRPTTIQSHKPSHCPGGLVRTQFQSTIINYHHTLPKPQFCLSSLYPWVRQEWKTGAHENGKILLLLTNISRL